MFKFIILFTFGSLLLHFTVQPEILPSSSEVLTVRQDTVPLRVDEALIQELIGDLQEKTWRDSGYYFRLEAVNWIATRLGTTQNGDVIMLTSFSSADPSSLSFLGQAVLRFNPENFPGDITPSKGMRGEALLAFPEDVLLCPSPSQEVGLGQNDPYFPLYLTGEITGVQTAGGGGILNIETPVSVQLRDIEIIL